jgi:predicted CXXCH cytochrome family protein
MNTPLSTPWRGAVVLGVAWALRLLLTAFPAAAQDDSPHSRAEHITCTVCHINHDSFGNQIGSLDGNANMCLSCHQVGGTATRRALAEHQQAASTRGTSHRWDASVSGRVEPAGDLPTEALVPEGLYTGRHPASYTITITSAGNSGTARFNWDSSIPGGASAADVLTGEQIPLEFGLRVSFRDQLQSPAFQPGDQWRISVRPRLNFPSHPDLLRKLADGKVVCSTCHNAHSQAMTPFDPLAPPYVPRGGEGRHFMRMNNDTDQMCFECHAGRFVTNALAGSHPVGALVNSNATLHPPTSLPLDKHVGRMWCSTCHQLHDSPGDDGRLLRAASEPSLCSECHALADTLTPAVHLNPEIGPLWPGGQYGSLLPVDADPAHRGGCGNCHRVHGWPDPSTATNDYPSLLVEREENLCFTCHDGSPSTKNLRATFSKPYRHPVSLTGRHTTTEDGIPARYGTANRHSECADCHNPHRLDTDRVPPVPPAASSALRGVARVSVTNVSATSVSYTFRGATDPAPVKEYEVCFVCHSGWTTRPAGQADYALKFNTRTASFHPVESAGKNTNINANAFVNGWSGPRIMTCTDCHTSDDTTIRGPHGSAYQYILKKSYTASPAVRTMASGELCFDCHNYDTYANSAATTTVRNYSRFGGSRGHAYHVGSRRYPCYACHETHGAANQPHLMVLGRTPGMRTYTRTANGGNCTASCHGSENYSVAYPR